MTPRYGLWAAGAGLVLVAVWLASTKSGFFLVAPAVLLVFALALRLGRRLVLSIAWARPPRLLDAPIPDGWRKIAESNIPLFARLTETEQERLLKLAQLFIATKHFEGCGGFEITDEVKVTIAGQACLLLLGSGLGAFPTLRTILVYPDAYEAPDDLDDDGGIVDFGDGLLIAEPDVETREGESWDFGTVVLSWANVVAGQRNAYDGRNLVLHEFAHQRDLEDGETDGTPPLENQHSLQTWGAVLGRHYEKLRRDVRRGHRNVLDEYGSTNPAEFFAVATEAFFEKPVQLRKKNPELYTELARFYGVDSAVWFGGEPSPPTHTGEGPLTPV